MTLRPQALTGAVVVGAIASWLSRLPESTQLMAAADLHLYFYPTYEAVYRHWAADFPTWNPYQLCGIPWLATLQGGFFYPFHALYLVLPLHAALAASHLIHISLAALFMTAFARRAGLTWAATILATMLFVLRGMFAAALAQPNYLEAATWLPLAALGVLELANGSRLRGSALVATSVAASYLAGYPQPTTYMVYVLPTLLGAALFGEHATLRRWIVSVGLLGIAIGLGALAAAIQLLPALELVGRECAPRPVARGEGHVSVARRRLPHAFSDRRRRVLVGRDGARPRGDRPLQQPPARPRLVGDRDERAHGRLRARRQDAALPCLSRPPLARRLPLSGSRARRHGFRGRRCRGARARCDRRAGSAPLRRRVAAGVALAMVAALVALSRWWGARGADQMPILAGGLVAGILLARAIASDAARRERGLLAAGLVLLAAVLAHREPWRHGITYSADAQRSYDTFASDYRRLATAAGHDRAWVTPGLLSLKPEHAIKLATRYRVRTIADYEPLPLRRQAQYFTYFSEGRVEFRRATGRLFNGADRRSSLLPADVRPAATRRRLLDLAAVRFSSCSDCLSRPDMAAFIRDGGFERRPPIGWCPCSRIRTPATRVRRVSHAASAPRPRRSWPVSASRPSTHSWRATSKATRPSARHGARTAASRPRSWSTRSASSKSRNVWSVRARRAGRCVLPRLACDGRRRRRGGTSDEPSLPRRRGAP